jgi:two-component system nitrogen regulation response regulator NtrX
MRLHPILIISSQLDTRQAFKNILQDQRHPFVLATSSGEALSSIAQAPPFLVFMDVFMNQGPNFYLLSRIRTYYPELPIILLTDTKTLDMASSGLQKGASDFLVTPLNLAYLQLSMTAFLDKANKALNTNNEQDFLSLPSITTLSLEKRLLPPLFNAAPLLIQGECGVGKEALALWLHKRASQNNPAPFHTVDACAFQAQTFDETLFGQEERGFGLTKVGLLDYAYGGTLLIRNIDELIPDAQRGFANLLRKRTFKRSQGSEIALNTRIIATSTLSLETLAQRGLFSQTLLDYLKINTIYLPPLCERKQDIGILANHFLDVLCQHHHRSISKISPQSLSSMEKYHWPGNINELRNTLERGLIMSNPKGTAPLVFDIPQNQEPGSLKHMDFRYLNHPLKQARMLFEQHYLKNQLERFEANIQRTAAFVGMERSALHRKIRILGLDNYHKRDKKIAS